MEIMKIMSTISDAELILARARAVHDRKKPRIIGFDVYYVLLLADGFLPGTAIFPNRSLTRELHADMVERVPDLRFTTPKKLGRYFGQEHYRELGITLWRHETGNGWAFPRLVTLRRAWQLRMGSWNWPNGLTDWTWNPELV
jgi:hypothetical protein